MKLGENEKKNNSFFSLERHLDVLNKLINDAVLSQ